MPESTEETRAAPASERDVSLDATMQSGPHASLDGGALERGAVVGRYVVLSKLGAGAMGIVYAAYDPELDRKVALKLLLPGRGGSAASASKTHDARARLLREAQALGKLSHPNVVGVHDVGTVGERVWIAMEFVDGQTLGAWLKAEPRRWPKVVEVMTAAGRGLAAAHAAGLLHRDFKPDNVMVGTDGRVRVMDFGLARARREGEADMKEADLGETKQQPELAALAVRMTQAGALMGTPAYMSPEQLKSEAATAASDQFGFCVTLWEALYGERPFGGGTLIELAAAVLDGTPRAVPRGSKVPRWLERVCRRGLANAQAQRFARMEALLSALERGHVAARRKRGLAGVVALAGIGAAAFGVHQWDVAQRTAACETAGQQLQAEAWNDATKAKLRDGLLATGVSYAATTADKVMPWFDKQAVSWAAARTGACMDAEVHGTWTDEQHDHAAWCLDEHRFAFEALVTELSVANETSIQKAVTAAAKLRPVTPCREVTVLDRRPAPPADREGVQEVRRALSRAGALRAAGEYDAGLEVAESALERAEGLQWPPLVVAARAKVGSLLSSAGRYEEAESASSDAYFGAVKLGMPDVAADVATWLVYLVGGARVDHEGGRQWARHADAALVALGEGDDGLRRAGYRNNLATVHDAAGEYDEAKALSEGALAIRQKALGPEHPSMAVSLNNLATVHEATGAYEEAKALHERALAIREKSLGPEHPDVASSLNNLAIVYYVTGAYEEAKAGYGRALAIQEKSLGPEHPSVAASFDNLATVHRATGAYEEAKAGFERALAIREKSLGPEHPSVAASLNNLATVHEATGAYEEAKALHERALAIMEKSLGPEHPSVATSLNNLANIHHATGAYGEAKAGYERALAIKEESLGPEHPSLAASLNNLATVHEATGSHDTAKALLERALAIREKALGAEHPRLAYSLTGLAEVALAQSRLADAVAFAERAVRLRESGDTAPAELAESRFMLARTLWEAPPAPDAGGRDRARARELAEQARATWAEATGADDDLAEVEAWLKEHPLP